MISCKFTTFRLKLAYVLASCVLVACATSPVKSSPEESVKQRASQRANAFIKGDLESSYGLTAPSYRKLRDLEAYKRNLGSAAKWETAEIKSVTCEPQRCRALLSVNVKPLIRGRFGDTITVQFEEIWLLEDGNWWLHQGL